MFNPGIEGFEIGVNHFMAEEIRDAIENQADAHCEHHDSAPFDTEYSQALLPREQHLHQVDGHDQPRHLTIGTPNGAGFTHQTMPFSCAVVSQKMILDQFGIADPQTGEPLSEDRLILDAVDNGWLSEHGTPVHDMANLLHYNGLPCHHGSGWHSLVNDLSAGHQVVMALNANPLWYESLIPSPLTHLFENAPNHALVLRGMRVDEHNRVVVVVNDPGQRDGGGIEYPFAEFQTALAGNAFHYVATDIAPPGWILDPQCSHLAHSALESLAEACRSKHKSDDCSYADYIESLNEDQKQDFMRDL